MVQEKITIKILKSLSKVNISMEEEMEKEKNIIIRANYFLMVNIKMEKDGMEKDIIKMVIQNLK